MCSDTPSAGDRKRIVGRLDGSTTRVTCAEIHNVEELAFAVKFLIAHYVYKQTKSAPKPTFARAAAIMRVAEDVSDELDNLDPEAVLQMAMDKVNPYNRLDRTHVWADDETSTD